MDLVAQIVRIQGVAVGGFGFIVDDEWAEVLLLIVSQLVLLFNRS
jgi:hypothetical protein